MKLLLSLMLSISIVHAQSFTPMSSPFSQQTFTKTVTVESPYQIRQNELAPFQGVLLSDSHFIEASNAKRELKLSDLRIEGLSETVSLQREEIKRLNADVIKEKDAAKESSVKADNYGKIGFALGILTTLIITGIASQQKR